MTRDQALYMNHLLHPSQCQVKPCITTANKLRRLLLVQKFQFTTLCHFMKVVNHSIVFLTSSLYLRVADCVFRFSSLTQRSGNFSSPNHPQPYFANVECRYIFEGHSRERIQLTFNSIDLYYPDGNPNDAKE